MEGVEDILEPNNSFENLPKVAGKQKRRNPEDWKQNSIKKNKRFRYVVFYITFFIKK